MNLTCLQCSIPAFEGLLPEPYNSRLMKLLYRTAEWHAFAKMRLHTDTTLKHLEGLTTELGKLMRGFEDSICSHFQTFELPREVEARKRSPPVRGGLNTNLKSRKETEDF